MDEIKNKTEQLNAQQGNLGGRKRRRHRGGKGNKGNNQNGENRAQQPQSAQAPQKPQNNQNGNKPKGDKQKNRQEKNAQPQQNNQKQSQKQQPKQPQPQKQNNAQNGNKQKGNKPERQEKQDKREENRKDTYVYTLDGNLYINLTNKCSNACDFCVRNERSSYYGNYLWLKNGDPTVEKVIAAANGFGDLSRFNEVVFCGFGEPTYKVAEMVALCDFFHEKGLKTRLNTNGQGNLINKRDIVPDLKDKIDFVNISLNASCYEKYQPICRSQFKEAGFEGMIEFAKLCRRNGVNCRFSIVDCIGETEVEACKRLAQSVNIPLYVRSYITDS